jgi:hypothetical protein
MAGSNFLFFVLAEVKSMSRTLLYPTLLTAFGNIQYAFSSVTVLLLRILTAASIENKSAPT